MNPVINNNNQYSQSLSSSSFHTSNEMTNSPHPSSHRNPESSYDSLSAQSSPMQMNPVNYSNEQSTTVTSSTPVQQHFLQQMQTNLSAYCPPPNLLNHHPHFPSNSAEINHWNQMLSCFQGYQFHQPQQQQFMNQPLQNHGIRHNPDYAVLSLADDTGAGLQEPPNSPISMVVRPPSHTQVEKSEMDVNSEQKNQQQFLSEGKKLKNRKLRQPRTLYTDEQVQALNHRFSQSQYLNLSERAQLASELGLKQTQIKVWFQNRRSKLKKIIKTGQDVGSIISCNNSEHSNQSTSQHHHHVKCDPDEMMNDDSSPVSILSDCQDATKYYPNQTSNDNDNKENLEPNNYTSYVKNHMAWLEMNRASQNDPQSTAYQSYEAGRNILPFNMFNNHINSNNNDNPIFKPYNNNASST